jgi:hypothetical protein
VVTLAELSFGAELPLALGKGDSPTLRKIIADARAHAILDLSHHTATAYSQLKVGLL